MFDAFFESLLTSGSILIRFASPSFHLYKFSDMFDFNCGKGPFRSSAVLEWIDLSNDMFRDIKHVPMLFWLLIQFGTEL